MRALPPDRFDINVILESKLKCCPFCGDRLAAIINRVNDETTIFRSLIACSQCGGQVGYNDRDLNKAREGAIGRWNKRVQLGRW